MIRYVIAASSSKGNATLIYSENTIIQIDMGVSLKLLNAAIEQTPYELNDIKALLVTHEHHDHVQGLKLKAYEKLSVPIYCGEGTLKRKTINAEPESSFDVGDFTIIPLRTSHDANNPLGYIVINGCEKLVYMTDTGYVPEEDLPYMKDANHYIFESNHDIRLLELSNRPEELKERILSKKGHLSNVDSAEYMSQLVGPKTRSITLAHLSLECNTPKKTISTYKKVFKKHHLNIDDYNVRCAPQFGPLLGVDQ